MKMVRNLFFTVTVLGVLIQAVGAAENASNETKPIVECYYRYKSALLNQDGEAAAQVVDANTIRYYSQMLEQALTGEAETIRSLSFMNKMVVLMIRDRLTTESLTQMNGHDLFVHAVNHGWIGKDSVSNNEIGKITVQESHATGQHISKGKVSPLKWSFRKRDGIWKLDLTPMMPIANQAFKKIIEESGLSEDEFIFSILESISGKKLDESIWEPLVSTRGNERPESDDTD